MPMYDKKCNLCGHIEKDIYETVNAVKKPCHQRITEVFVCYGPSQGTISTPCGGTMERVILPGTKRSVIGDECDVWIKNGICNEDGSPRHYTSKQEMKREAERRGVRNRVEHIGAKGSDRSKHTTRWI